MLYLGFTTMIRASYNPFADPTLLYFAIGVPFIAIPFSVVLKYLSNAVGLWKVTGDDRITVDIAEEYNDESIPKQIHFGQSRVARQ